MPPTLIVGQNATDHEWIEAMGGEKIMRVGQTPQYYAVRESAIDLTKDLDVMEHVVVL